jgi:hypothetical protein
MPVQAETGRSAILGKAKKSVGRDLSSSLRN